MGVDVGVGVGVGVAVGVGSWIGVASSSWTGVGVVAPGSCPERTPGQPAKSTTLRRAMSPMILRPDIITPNHSFVPGHFRFIRIVL